MLISDMGMPAGGRFNGGHQSPDRWMDIFCSCLKTRWASAHPLAAGAGSGGARRQKRCAVAVTPDVFSLIKLAAKDNEVTRDLSLTWPSSGSSAPDEGTIATGCAKCVRGSSIVRICTYLRCPAKQSGM